MKPPTSMKKSGPPQPSQAMRPAVRRVRRKSSAGSPSRRARTCVAEFMGAIVCSVAGWGAQAAGRSGPASERDAAGAQDRVADERDRVEDRMADDERHDAPGADEDEPEDEAHDDVAGEAAEALVEVVAATDEGGQADDERPRPPGLTPPREEVAHHDDLLEHGVLDGGQHKHG